MSKRFPLSYPNHDHRAAAFGNLIAGDGTTRSEQKTVSKTQKQPLHPDAERRAGHSGMAALARYLGDELAATACRDGDGSAPRHSIRDSELSV
jgi:hypothetical protein